MLLFFLSLIAFPSAVHSVSQELCILQASHSWRRWSKSRRRRASPPVPSLFLSSPSWAWISANAGVCRDWMERPPASLSSAQPSFGNCSSLCNKKILFYFFLLKVFIAFAWNVCEKVPSSEWNLLCNRKNVNWQRQKNKWTILFISIFKRKKVLTLHCIFV